MPSFIIFRYVSIGLLLGFILGQWALLPFLVLLVILFIVIGLFKFKLAAPAVAWLVLGLIIAMLRLTLEPKLFNFQEFLGPQEFKAQIVSEPRFSDKAFRYVAQPVGQVFKLLLITRPYPQFSYGDIVYVKCKRVQVIDFSWYQQQGIARECAFPEISLISPARGSVRAWLLQLRGQAGDRLRTALPEPYATLATGMLWGDDAGLPRELSNDFRRTGTSHLLAVSGANVAVLVNILFAVFLNIGLRRRWASLTAVGLIGLFVLFTGAEPAVVRAGIMGSIIIMAKLVSRLPNMFNIMVGTAVIMLFISPQLLTNLGFQLSFAALAGMSWLGRLVKEKLTWLTERWGVREAAADTLSASVGTLPIILLRLGQLSVVSPLANIMIAPAVQFIFVLGLPILALSFWSVAIMEFFSWTITSVLWYIIFIVKAWARVPGAVAGNMYWAYVLAFVMYAGLARWLKVRIKTKLTEEKIFTKH